MENVIITEEKIKEILNVILVEQSSKVTSKDITRIDFKIDEFISSLNEATKEFRQLQESIPDGLSKVTLKKMSVISNNLTSVYTNINDLKSKLLQLKKSFYKKNIEVENKDLQFKI